ncbi:MAG TPA: ParB/RepB/Spo0J family partition protein [Acidobacteriota bacterium]|nr:ParB/RepB/Spo0J family partition protein [Acidobacteriota bacterium]
MATNKRKALGRGLGSLLPSVPVGVTEKALLEIPLDQIVPNKHQPRSNFDPEKLRELAQSIRSNGVVQPVIVRKAGGHYQLIAGERRWRAAREAGLKSIPAVLKDVSEYKTLELALIENIQRADLNPIEEATAYSSLIEDFQLTQEEVAQRVGKDRSSVANYIRLLKLPDQVKEKIEKSELSMGHARALSSLTRAHDQVELAERIVSQQLNVRQVEDLIRHWKSGGRKPKKAEPASLILDPNVKSAEHRLQEHFGTRVFIHQAESGKGKIEIHYENMDDLIRIYDMIVRDKE